MKQVPQNEMDVLLRKLSRSDEAAEVKSAHLDSDELSAYAENMLPAVARARYTEHLADCATCRRIVADLAPVTVAVTAKQEAQPSSVREFFSKLIAPSFLRYAVPSLAAVLIVALGFLVVNRQTTQNETRQMVARNEDQSIQKQQEVQSPNTSLAKAESDKPASPNNKQSEPKAQTHPAKTTSGETQPQSTPAIASADERALRVEAEKRADIARNEAARQVAAAPPAPPPVDVGRVNVATSVSQQAEKKEKSANEPVTVTSEAQKESERDAPSSAPKTRAARSRGAEAGAGSRTGDFSMRKQQAKDDSQVRRVGGRSFQRVNGVWTDTDYDSRATTNLSRGSEQFRSLVADEPVLRTIAEALDGDVIVVWKGRAYRIK